jgi:hypothetical protein
VSKKQLYFLCGVIMFSVANIFRPWLLQPLAAALFIYCAWWKPMTECLPDLPRYICQRGDEWQGADHPCGPWRPIPAPQSGLPWKTDGPAVPESREPASVAAEARPLSPAAQAVLDSFWKQPGDRSAIAAALCAAADHVVPEAPDSGNACFPYNKGAEDRQQLVRFRLLAIAAELEGFNG